MEVILFYSDNICQNIGLNVLENNLIAINFFYQYSDCDLICDVFFFTNIPIVI